MVLRKHGELLWQLLIGPNEPFTFQPRFAANTFNMIDFLAVFPGSSQSWLGLLGWFGWRYHRQFPHFKQLLKNSWRINSKKCIDKKKSGRLTKKYPTKISPVCLDFTFWNLTFTKRTHFWSPFHPKVLTRDPLRYLSLLGVMLRQGDQQQSFAHLGKATCVLKKKTRWGGFFQT